MAEKDIAEKNLEAWNDVFADIANVLLFNGKRLIKEDELEADTKDSMFKADDELHEQERDVSKYWNGASETKARVRIALLGIENQTKYDKDMPLRVMGYDGASYRAELQQKVRYLVITLVLYFGKEPWGRNRSLYDVMDIPKGLESCVSDYRINVFEIARMPEEAIEYFHSDFRIVADYFIRSRENPDYRPSDPEKSDMSMKC